MTDNDSLEPSTNSSDSTSSLQLPEFQDVPRQRKGIVVMQGLILTVAILVALVFGSAVGLGVYFVSHADNGMTAVLTTAPDAAGSTAPVASPEPPKEGTGTAVTPPGSVTNQGKPSGGGALAPNALMPVWAGIGTVYVPGAELDSTAGSGNVYSLEVDAATVQAQVNSISAAFGFGDLNPSGTEPQQWSIQENAGTPNERSLYATASGMGQFNYSRQSPYTYGCGIAYPQETQPVPAPMGNPNAGAMPKGTLSSASASPVESPVEPASPSDLGANTPTTQPSAVSGSASSGGGTVSPDGGVSFMPCRDSQIYVPPISSEKAKRIAEEKTIAIYGNGANVEWEAVQSGGGSLVSLNGYLVVEGARSGPFYYMTIDPEGTVVNASGILASPALVGEYPTVSQRDAVERANSSRWAWTVQQDYSYPGPMPYATMMGSGSSGGSAGVTGSTGGVPAPVPMNGGSMTLGAPESSTLQGSAQPDSLDAAVTVPQTEVTVTRAEAAWVTYYQQDGSVRIVPAWHGYAESQASWLFVSLDESAVQFVPQEAPSGPIMYAQ